MKLIKGQKVLYKGNIPYTLANSQKVLPGNKITIFSDVNVGEGLFEILLDLNSLHEEALKENEQFNLEVKAKAEAAEKAKAETAKNNKASK